MMERILPIAMIALSIGASAAYALTGDPRRAIYWAAAAVLTTTVTL
jgi:hypothetical protein